MNWLIRFLLRNISRQHLITISLQANRVMAFFLRGNKVECPICGGHFKTFLPYGYIKGRPNVLCPKCLSLERHRALWLFLKEKTDFFFSKKKVLHIAPEQCFYKKFRSLPNLEYITADLSSPLADVKLDIHEIPFDDESFDMVICNHVLEHVENDRKAMREIYRVIKYGGTAIMQVPLDISKKKTYENHSVTSPTDREKHFGQYDHVRLYGMDYAKRLQDTGFNVEMVDNSGFDITLIEKYRLSETELLPLCRKEL